MAHPAKKPGALGRKAEREGGKEGGPENRTGPGIFPGPVSLVVLPLAEKSGKIGP